MNHQPKVKVAPKAQPRRVRSKTLTWEVESKGTAAPGRVTKVVANNSRVRLGAPLTVTVGTLAAGEGGVLEGVEDAARIENWSDIPTTSPMVELMKMR